MGSYKDQYTEQLLGYSSWRTVVSCKHCGKDYIQVQTDQTPGFRSSEDDVCPYCHEVNRSSLAVEFDNFPMDEGESNG